MTKFKIILTAIFGVCIVLGLGTFAVFKGGSTTMKANIVVWGTIPSEAFESAIKGSSLNNNKLVTVKYVKKDKSDFDTSFVEALADGKGPDIVILREDQLYKNRNKILTIPYKSYTERTFKDTFIQEGELFLTSEGMIALPFIVDPLVMYWNRDIFSNNMIINPPKYWDEMQLLVEKITSRDSSANITKSALSLGEWKNITNAKEIISMLLLQSGTPISMRTTQGVGSVINQKFDYQIIPSQSAIDFYVRFSNPTSASYSWNRSLPSSLNFFLSGDLAIYFGFASEIFSIQQKNSNLNFDVTSVPQVRDAPKKINFAHMYGLSIVKQSKQISSAFTVVKALTEPGSIKGLESITRLPPVRKDLLEDRPSDAYRSVFYSSALISRSWIDPEPEKTSEIFRDMIESITSGKFRVSDALSRVDTELSALFK
jgi:ABC-type glycerol-3-phosphate transport system substrate-binding protein